MARLLFAAILSLSLLAASAFPQTGHGNLPAPMKSCRKVNNRKEWHDLTIPERKGFIKAVICLQSTPGVYKNIAGIRRLTAYEDFTYQHKIESPYVHWVSHFLAWHRYLLWIMEQTLRSKCNYKGYLPYWDQTIDRANSSLSVIYNNEHGFGGNGKYIPPSILPPLGNGSQGANPLPGDPQQSTVPPGSGGGCVQTGPFAEDKYVLRLSRWNEIERDDHCLERDFGSEVTAYWCTPEREADLMKLDKYTDFDRLLQGSDNLGDLANMGIHGAGHYTISGRVGDPFASPGDPMFYMHHANIDRIWRDWQKVDPENRLYQIGGPIRPWTNLLNPDPKKLPPTGTEVDLNYKFGLGKLGPKRAMNELMDTANELLCYDYA